MSDDEKERKSRQGRANRRCGHDWERRGAQLFTEHGMPARRGIQYRDGAEAPDVIVEGVPFFFEFKCGGRPSVRKTMAQVQKAAEGTGLIPAGVIRDKGMAAGEAYVVMMFSDFLDREQEIKERLG